MDRLCLSAQAARGRVATPCGRSNGAVAPLRVSWGGVAAARPPRAARPATRAHCVSLVRSARCAAQRLGSRSDASLYYESSFAPACITAIARKTKFMQSVTASPQATLGGQRPQVHV